MNLKLILATATDNTSKLPVEYSLPKRTISLTPSLASIRAIVSDSSKIMSFVKKDIVMIINLNSCFQYLPLYNNACAIAIDHYVRLRLG